MKSLTMMICFILVACGVTEPDPVINEVDSIQRIVRVGPDVIPPHPRLLEVSVRTAVQKVGVRYLLTAYLHSPIERNILVVFVDNDRDVPRPKETGRRRSIATEAIFIKGDAKVGIIVSKVPANWGILIWE